MPREFSTATWAFLIFDAATIFMAFVIFPMFLMALMRCLTAGRKKPPPKREYCAHLPAPSVKTAHRLGSKPLAQPLMTPEL